MPYFEFQGEGELFISQGKLFSKDNNNNYVEILPNKGWNVSFNVLYIKKSSQITINLPGFTILIDSDCHFEIIKCDQIYLGTDAINQFLDKCIAQKKGNDLVLFSILGVVTIFLLVVLHHSK
jgi:hypothetical protein